MCFAHRGLEHVLLWATGSLVERAWGWDGGGGVLGFTHTVGDLSKLMLAYHH
jgi:hypothetical protein